MNKSNYIRFIPIGLNLLLISWTVVVSPYSEYGDNWAIYPVILIFLIIIALHCFLIFTEKAKINFILYAVIHIGISFIILMYCLMKISKDSL